MGLGTLVKDVLTLGGTARRRNRKASKLRKQQNEQIRLNTELAQQMFDRDLGQSRFEGMAADPALVEAQRRALGQTEQVAREGYTDVDRQAMNQQLNDVARYEQSQRATLADQARARGVTGSGLDIASQLAAQQSGADRAMQTGTDMALAGRQRAYDANQDAASMAGQMRGQDFGERAQVAGALDNFGQWRIGQQSSDAASLANARLGQAQNYGNQAQGMEDAFSEGVDQAIAIGGAIGNAYTGGAAGAVGSAAGFQSGSLGSNAGTGGTPWIAGSPGGPAANVHTTAQYGANIKGMGGVNKGGAPQAPAAPPQPNPAQPANPRPAGPANPAQAVASMYGGGGGAPAARRQRKPNRQNLAAQRAMGRTWRG